MSHPKKNMTPAQKAAARWDDARTTISDKPPEATTRPTDQTPPYLTIKNVLIAIAGMALVAAFSYFSTGGFAG